MRKITSFLLSMLLAIIALPIQAAVNPEVVIDEEFTDLASLEGKAFAIVNKETGKALYGTTAQNLGYDVLSVAFSESNTGYYFKLEAPQEDADNPTIASCYLLRLITPAGAGYDIWGSHGYINTQPAGGDCSFILGLAKGNGEDIKNGAVFKIAYVPGEGFDLYNVGTGKYLNDNLPAKYDEPVHWTFCTLKKDFVASFKPLFDEEAKIKANGTSDEANAAYDAAVADIKAAVESGTLENAEQALADVDAALTVLAKAQTAAGSDFTRAIVNPTIDGDAGWTCERPYGGNGPLLSGSSFEYWAGNANPRNEAQFDYYQEITGIPNGTYTVSAEMYNSLNGEAGATFTPTCGVYAKSGATEIVQPVTEDGATLTEYSVSGIKVKDGTIRIGVKSISPLAARWFVADNFHLTLVEASSEEPTPTPKPEPEASLIKNPSFEADGEQAASNGPLSITGWTFEGVGSQFSNTEIRPAGSASSTSPYGTSAPSEGSYSLFFRQGWNNGSGNVITLTSDEITELPAGNYKLSVDYKSCYGYDDTMSENTTVGIALKNGETTYASKVSAPAETGKGSTYFNEAPWSTLTATFTLDETLDAGSKVVITLNAGGQKRSDFFIDNVQLVKISNTALAAAELNNSISAASALVEAKANVGDGLFMIPTDAYNTLAEELAAAKAVAENEAATAEELSAAKEALDAAVETYKATPATTPGDKQYVLSVKTSDENSPYQLSITSEKISIEKEGTPVTFVAKDNGTYALTNGTEYVVYKGGNTWDMSTTANEADAFGWTISPVEGGYSLMGNNGRFFGTNSSNGNAAGSTCYGDKKTDNGNYIWTIEEYVPALATIKSVELSKLENEQAAFNKDNMTYDFWLSLSADVDESVENNTVAEVKANLTCGEESEVVTFKVSLPGIAEATTIGAKVPVEYGKSYTLDIASVGIYEVSDDLDAEPKLLTEKTYAAGEVSMSFDTPEAPAPELATIAEDVSVTFPEGELEVDEGMVTATFNGLISADESIAADAQAFLYYTLKEKAEDAGDDNDTAIKGGGIIGDEDESDFVELYLDQESQEFSLFVDPGKEYTLTVDSVVVNYYDYNLDDIATAAKKTFEGDNAIVIDFATKPELVLATIADDATVTIPEGELEVDENGNVHATFKGLISVDESIADKGGAMLSYTLTEEPSDAALHSEEDEDEDIDFDETGYIKLNVGVEEQEILIPAELGKKYSLTINYVVAGYYEYDEEEGEEVLEFVAGKEYVGDNALVLNFSTKPELAKIGFVELSTVDKALIDKEDGQYPVRFTYDVTVDESVAVAEGRVYYTVTAEGKEPVSYDTDFDVEKGERTIYIPGLDYETTYTVTVDKVVISYMDLEVFDSHVAAISSPDQTSSVIFTTNTESETTGIEGINAAKAANGKYVENGKVVIVKDGKKISVAGVGIK